MFLLHSRSVFLLRSRSAFLLRSRSALLLCNRSTLLLLFMSALLLYTMWCWVVRGVWWCGGGRSVGDASGNGVDGFQCWGWLWWWVLVVMGNVCRWCSWVAVVIDGDGEQTLCALLLRNRNTLLLCNRSGHLLWFKSGGGWWCAKFLGGVGVSQW